MEYHSCPFIKKGEKGCSSHFPLVVKSISYLFCKSDAYKKCPLYSIIVNKKPYCIFFKECCEDFHRILNIINKETTTVDDINHFFYEFCLSEDYKTCARYIKKELHMYLPKNMLPDGSYLKSKHLIVEKTDI